MEEPLTVALAWIVQGLAVVTIAAAVLRVLPGMDAATRHATWWFVLLVVLALPALGTWSRPDPWSTAATFSRQVRPPVPAGAGPEREATPRRPALLVPAPPRWMPLAAVAVWAVLVALGGARIAAALREMARLKRTATPLPDVRCASVRRWLDQRRRRVAFLVSEDVAVPCALGLGRPVVLIPRRMADALHDGALAHVLLHEYAHLARYDDVWRLVQSVVEAIAGVHPAVRVAAHRIEAEREAAADDYVVARTGRPREYAKCLADVAEIALTQRVGRGRAGALVPAMSPTRSTLRRRVERLLDERGPRSRAAGLASAVGVWCVLAGAIAVLASAGPLVVVTDGRAGVPEARPLAAPAVTLEAPASQTPERLGPRVAPRPAMRRDRAAMHVPSRRVRAATAVSTSTTTASAATSARDPELSRASHAFVPAPEGSQAAFENSPVPATAPRSAEEPGLLAGKPVNAITSTALPLAPWPASGRRDAASRGPWRDLADAGVAVGTASRRAGVSVDGFFTRLRRSAARAVASNAPR